MSDETDPATSLATKLNELELTDAETELFHAILGRVIGSSAETEGFMFPATSTLGLATAAIDVCKTPAAPGPTPIPYPIAMRSDDTTTGRKPAT